MSAELKEWNEFNENTSGITTQQLDAMGREYQAKYKEYEAANSKAKLLFHEAEELEVKMVEAMTAAGKTKYYVEGVGTFYFSNKMSVKTPKTIEDKKAFFKYLWEKHGETFYWDKISVNSQVLQKIYNEDAKSAAENGEAIFHIPGLEQPKSMTSLNFKGDKI